jgi:hypothetical protein
VILALLEAGELPGPVVWTVPAGVTARMGLGRTGMSSGPATLSGALGSTLATSWRGTYAMKSSGAGRM